MKKDIYKVEIELLEDMLGTVPQDKDVYETHIATKHREQILKDAKKGIPLSPGQTKKQIEEEAKKRAQEEGKTVPEGADPETRGWTSFHRDEEGPFIYNYLVKGFLCEAARTLKEWGQLKQLQDKFKRYVFVTPRMIRLPEIAEGEAGYKSRPLRASTPQGPRVTVVRSDLVPAGTVLEFQLHVLHGAGITLALIEEVLEYGMYMGLGQWRSGSWGSFLVRSIIPGELTAPKRGRKRAA